MGLDGAVDPMGITRGGEKFLHVKSVEVGEKYFTVPLI